MCLIMIILKHKKTGLYPFSKKHSFEKTTGGGQIDCPSAFLGLNKKKKPIETDVFIKYNNTEQLLLQAFISFLKFSFS